MNQEGSRRELTSAAVPDSKLEGEESEHSAGSEPLTFSSWLDRHTRSLLEWVVVIVVVIVAVTLIKTFAIQAYYIPSGSMESTLNINDRVLVNKLSYDLHAVHEGDIVVFKKPRTDTERGGPGDLIKRVIGLPGQTISAQGGYIYIDGKQLKESYLPKADRGVSCFEGIVNGQLINTSPAAHNCGNVPPQVVPQGDYFVMGDNRTNSMDSRVFGPIPKKLIVGRAFARVWPLSRLSLWF